MSVTVDIEYPTEDKVESAGLTGQSRQSHQNLLGRRRSVLGRQHCSEESKPHSFDQASLSETIRQAKLGDSPAFDVGVPDLLLEGSIDRMRLEHCIKQLPAGYRAIFVLHDIHGYQHNEIAEIVGRSVGDSKSQLHKARMRLRELLHEVQREKARDDRLAERKLGCGSRGRLVPLTAD